MTSESTPQEHPSNRDPKARLEQKLAAVGWGLFLIWVGAGFLFNIGWGAGLIGVGIITLGMQAIRSASGLPLEGFWLVVGAMFLLGGIAETFALNLPVVPLVVLAVGIIVIWSVVGGRHDPMRRHHP